MPLNNGHKDFIENTISHLFDLPEREDELRTEIAQIKQAINERSSNSYEQLSRVFQDPRNISRIDDYNTPLQEAIPACIITMGDAREYMVEYINNLISKASRSVNKNAEDLGWNQDEIISSVRNREDHDTNIQSRHIGTREWQWDLQQQQVMDNVQMPSFADRLQNPNVVALLNTMPNLAELITSMSDSNFNRLSPRLDNGRVRDLITANPNCLNQLSSMSDSNFDRLSRASFSGNVASSLLRDSSDMGRY